MCAAKEGDAYFEGVSHRMTVNQPQLKIGELTMFKFEIEERFERVRMGGSAVIVGVPCITDG